MLFRKLPRPPEKVSCSSESFPGHLRRFHALPKASPAAGGGFVLIPKASQAAGEAFGIFIGN